MPSNALLNTRSVALHFNATANAVADQGGRLPPKIESLIDRIEISAGGVTLAQGFNGYNLLAHAKQNLMGNKCDSVLGHPEMVRAKSYVDGVAITGIENEDYSANNGATQFCIDRWEGFLGSCEPSIMDTALLPDITMSIYLAGDEVLTSCPGSMLVTSRDSKKTRQDHITLTFLISEVAMLVNISRLCQTLAGFTFDLG